MCGGEKEGKISRLSKERQYPPSQAILSPLLLSLPPPFSFLMKLSHRPVLGLGAQLWSAGVGGPWLPAQSNLVN